MRVSVAVYWQLCELLCTCHPVCVLLLLLAGRTCGSPAVEPSLQSAVSRRIVGGVEARKNSWPWQCPFPSLLFPPFSLPSPFSFLLSFSFPFSLFFLPAFPALFPSAFFHPPDTFLFPFRPPSRFFLSTYRPFPLFATLSFFGNWELYVYCMSCSAGHCLQLVYF